MKETGDMPNIAKGKYRHYKGGVYEVFELACSSETLEWYVIYRSYVREKLNIPSVWARPYEMFIETVMLDGKKVPRFEKIDN